LLANNETLIENDIHDGHTLNLIAKLTPQQINSNIQIHPQGNFPKSFTVFSMTHKLFLIGVFRVLLIILVTTSTNTQREQDIFTRILRTLSDNSTSRSNQRRRALQQRTFGFPFNEMESLEVLRQNLQSIEQLNNSKSDAIPRLQ
jgi:hypothetical protein